MQGDKRRQGGLSHRVSHGRRSEIGADERRNGQNDGQAERRRARMGGAERAGRADRQNQRKPCAEREQDGDPAARGLRHRQRQKADHDRGADRELRGGQNVEHEDPPLKCNYTHIGNFLVLGSSGAGCRQSGVLSLLPEGISPAGGFLSGRCDPDLANPAILAFLDFNIPVPQERTEVAGQGRPLEAEELRKAGRWQGAGLNERRQQGELGSTEACASHRFFKRARQFPAPPARGGADALPSSQ